MIEPASTPPHPLQKPVENAVNDRDTPSFDSTTSTTTTSTTTPVGVEAKISTSSGSETSNWVASGHTPSFNKHHATANNDPAWSAIRSIHSDVNMISLQDLNFIKKLGSGDIGTVYLVELKGARGCLFAAKVMDKEELAHRSKEGRARIEREILEMLDHPFLPTLYTTMDTARWSCLLTEFCPGGDLHILRQRQPERRFAEAAVRFYASEVVAALEYLHMKGIIYRDLKPENILVRSDGHIMLTDFDLSLRCDNSKPTAQLVSSNSSLTLDTSTASKICPVEANLYFKSYCILPRCMVPAVSCFQTSQRRKRRPRHGRRALEIVAEPIEARSMSFVGTHEYLAPEVVSGEGHGSAVDWWTLGIFIFELFYGVTPFRGFGNEFTLSNIVARPLEFPKEPVVPSSAKDLITKLLIKNPTKRMGSTIGATAIKNHSFFDGVNWALLRRTEPPHIPQSPNTKDLVSTSDHYDASVEYY